jgi:hypothetical protein
MNISIIEAHVCGAQTGAIFGFSLKFGRETCTSIFVNKLQSALTVNERACVCLDEARSREALSLARDL